MSRKDGGEMNAELDKFMAEKVMEWHIDGEENGRLGESYYIKLDIDKVIYIMPVKDWHPTEDPGQALRCADKTGTWVIAKDKNWDMGFTEDYCISIQRNKKSIIHSLPSDATLDDIPLAICESIKQIFEAE